MPPRPKRDVRVVEWYVLDKYEPKDEATYRALCDAFEAADVAGDTRSRRAIAAQLEAISVSVAQTLGAPRVGLDERANAWIGHAREEALAIVAAPPPELPAAPPGFAEYWSRPLPEIIEDERGRYVLDLLDVETAPHPPMRDATPVALSTFVPNELRSRAFRAHSAVETAGFGRALLAALCANMRLSSAAAFQGMTDEKILDEFHRICTLCEGASAEAVGSEMRRHVKDSRFKWLRRTLSSVIGNDGAVALKPHEALLVHVARELDSADWLLWWSARGHGFESASERPDVTDEAPAGTPPP